MVDGKPILYWLSIDNLNYDKHDHMVNFIYIPYNQEYIKYNLEEKLITNYPNYKFKFLPLTNNTRGAAETIHIALSKLIDEGYDNSPVICIDGDKSDITY
jgi:hypothetical protein